MRAISLLAFLLLLLASIPATAAGAQPQACIAAAHAADWPSDVAPDAALRAAVERYRAGWRALCGAKGRHTLAALLAQADALSQSLDRGLDVARLDPDDPMVDRLGALDRFVPALRWQCCEGTGFVVDEQAYADAAALGTAEDRAFLRDYIAAGGAGAMPPWIEPTWDYGGCVRYGDYDWRGDLDRIGRMRAVARGAAYRARAERLETGLLRDGFVPAAGVQAGLDICACTDRGRDAVVGELRALSSHLARSGPFVGYRPGIDAAIRKLEAGRVVVRSQAQRHCSGG